MSNESTYSEHLNLRIRTPPGLPESSLESDTFLPVDESEFNDPDSPTEVNKNTLPDYFGDYQAYHHYETIKKLNKSLNRKDNVSFWLYTILAIVFFFIFLFKL